jgi:uncharacterized protein YceK
MKNFILGLVLLTTLSGCFRPDDIWANSNEVDYANLSPFFQSEYTNYAWGYSHSGWMMDRTGQVRRFQKSAKWVFPDSLGYISAVDMSKNMSGCDSVIAKVSPNDFTHYYYEKAINCVNGPMTKPRMTMADAGEHIYAFYIYDSGGNRYKRVILKMTGDWSQENLAPDASGIVDWMMTIK